MRESESRDAIGLTITDLCSEVGNYGACHRIGEVAHQLGLHGIIAPAASSLGETLAIFEDQLLENEQPALVEEQTWDSLPADPR